MECGDLGHSAKDGSRAASAWAYRTPWISFGTVSVGVLIGASGTPHLVTTHMRGLSDRSSGGFGGHGVSSSRRGHRLIVESFDCANAQSFAHHPLGDPADPSGQKLRVFRGRQLSETR